MAIRITSRGLAQAAIVAKIADPAVSIVFSAEIVSNNRALKFFGSVMIGAVEYELAGNNGKLRVFTDVDDLIKFLSAAIPSGSGDYLVVIKTGIALAASVPSDLIKSAAAKVVKLQAYKAAQNGVVTDINAQLALMVGWESGSPLQSAKLSETQDQKSAVLADIAAIDAEIVRLTP